MKLIKNESGKAQSFGGATVEAGGEINVRDDQVEAASKLFAASVKPEPKPTEIETKHEPKPEPKHGRR